VKGVVFLQNLPAVPEEIVPTGDLCLVDELARPLDYALPLRTPHTVRLLLHVQSDEGWQRSVSVHLEVPGAVVEVFALLRGSGHQRAQLSLSLHHHAAETSSHCILQAIAEDYCSILIQTDMAIAPRAHSCRAHLRSRSLLFSPTARVQIFPRMDIGTADARCTHGATLGGPDLEQLFYFASRGLDPNRAKQLLANAAAAEILQKAPVQMGETFRRQARIACL
jgi:Fe-S cluster assembly scaffold protein SufB